MSTGVLTQLLRTFNPARHHDQAHPHLDPEQENRYTQSLLFPETTLARYSNTLTRTYSNSESEPSFRGTRPEPLLKAIDLEYPRDVRVLIAQEDNNATGAQALLLFDSKSALSGDPLAQRVSKSNRNDLSTPSIGARHHARTPSVSVIPEDTSKHRSTESASTPGSFAQRAARQRKASISSLPEDTLQSRAREQDEVLSIAFGVMFENTASSLKVTSNKIHIVPMQKPAPDLSLYGSSLSHEQNSAFLSHRPSGTFSRRPSSLSQSFLPGEDRLQSPRLGLRKELTSRTRRTVLITRTFSITWTDSNSDVKESTNGREQKAESGQHRIISSATAVKADPSDHEYDATPRKVFRSPMYAITMVLQLPVASKDSPPGSRHGLTASMCAQKAPQVFGSSWGSEGRSNWGAPESIFGLDANLPQSFASDVDDRVDLIGQHWDIINRTMASLQVTIEERLLTLLRPLPKLYRELKLPARVLDKDEVLRRAINSAGNRVARGITLPRVCTGQGRWPLWQEEARWIAQKSDSSFFYILLSAFLGTQNEWIEALAAQEEWERYMESRRGRPTDGQDVLTRTIIVSPEKLVARRLLFLLSSFLPGSQVAQSVLTGLLPTDTPPFSRTYSESPPAGASVSRQQSLRRQINRRSRIGGQQSGSVQHNAINTYPDAGLIQDRADAYFVRQSSHEPHSRRGSDARSILGVQSTIDEMEPITRKSSATTGVTMIEPSPLSPIAFQKSRSSIEQPRRRPESGSSQASMNLNNALQRGSSDRTSIEGSRWGSLRSIWSMASRRDSTTEYSDILQTPDEGLGIAGLQRKRQSKPILERMVDEAESYRRDSTEQFCLELGPKVDEPVTPDIGPQSPFEEYPSTPRSPFAENGTRATINEVDGVIDVEIPFEQWGSPLQSPPVAAFTSDSSWEDGSMQSSLVIPDARDTEQHTLNVGGWLDRIHPDFTLQGAKPYDNLMAEIREAMSAENTPSISGLKTDNSADGTWITVCTTIIADTRDLSVKRLKLSRRVRIIDQNDQTILAAPHKPSRQDHDENCSTKLEVLEERFEEQTLTKADEQLTQAIEKLLRRSSNSHYIRNSAASSRSNSYRGRGKGRRRPTLEGMGIDIREDVADENHPVSRTGPKDASSVIINSDFEASSDLPRDVVLGALQELIRKVAVQRKSNIEAKLSEPVQSTGSTLEEGLMRWFDDLDAVNAASSQLDRPETSQPIDTPRIIARDHSDPAKAVSDAVRSLEV